MFIACSTTIHATNYYIASSGNDLNNGLSSTTPWKTLTKLNSFFKYFKPGDNILLNRGNVFYGSIKVDRSGSFDLPITIGAFGTGANPIISGFSILKYWKSLNDSIQQCSILLKTHPEMVTIDGIPKGRGRFPNVGFLTYESFIKDSSLTDNQLLITPNWTGAEVVIRGDAWHLTRNLITEQTGSKIKFTAAKPSAPMTNNFGYFIQNSIKTLDSFGEWYYNGKAFQMYFGNGGEMPAKHVIKISTIDTLIFINLQNFITINNITLEGADMCAIALEKTNHITIRNCSINYSGRIAIVNKGTHFTTVDNCNFNHTYNNVLSNEGPYSYKGPKGQDDLPDHEIITHNTIKNTGVIAGTGVYEVGGNYESIGDAIQMNGNYHLIEYNTIDSTGHSAISSAHSLLKIRNNFIDHFALTRNDAGGIYSVLSDSAGSLIENNVIINGIGNNGGMNNEKYLDIHGIYFDNFSKSITASANSIAHMHDCGIYVQMSHELNINSNTTFNCGYAGAYLREIISFTKDLVRNVNLKNNIFVSKEKTPQVFQFWTNSSTMPIFGFCDSNYYARPIDDSLTMTTGIGKTFTKRSLENWKTFTHLDINSNKSPKLITDSSELRFEYNASSSIKSVNLPFNFIDVKGLNYNGTIVLPPYSSLVLIKNEAEIKQLPKADAGPDQIIILPSNTIKLLASNDMKMGKISSYLWFNITPSQTAPLKNSFHNSLSELGLIEGLYKMILKETFFQNEKNYISEELTFNYQVKNGMDATALNTHNIDLKNSTILNGNSISTNGNSVKYFWSKISGPNTGTIESSNLKITLLNNLSDGVYKYELLVTDNNGAIGKDTVQIIVDEKAIITNEIEEINIFSIINNINLKRYGEVSNGTIITLKLKIFNNLNGKLLWLPNLNESKVDKLFQGVYNLAFTGIAENKKNLKGILRISKSDLNVPKTIDTKLEIFPNPIRNWATFKINDIGLNSKLHISILDIKGILYKQLEFEHIEKNTIFRVDMSNLNNGNYIINVLLGNGQLFSTKVLKLGYK